MTPVETHLSTAFLVTVAGAAARALVLGTLTAALLAAFRVKSVRAKLFAWKGVLLAALAMPVLMAITPGLRVGVPLPSLPVRSAAASAPLEARDTTTKTFETLSAPEVLPARPGKSARPRAHAAPARPVIPQAPAETSIVPAVAPPFVLARREIPWRMLLAGAYLAMVLGFLVRIALGIHYSHRLVRLSVPIEDPQALQPLGRASDTAGLRGTPWLAESEAVGVPVVIGVSRPTIVLSAGWRDWDADELAAVLAHEVSHVARRDALVQRLALIHRAIFWFSPLAWWLERRLADLAEQASDEAALAGGMDRTRYAEALLGFFAELEAGPQRVWWQGVSMAKAGQAEKRVDRILAWRGAMSNKLTKSLAVLVVAVAAPLVALTAAVRPTPHDLQASPAPATPPSPGAQAAPVAAPSPAAPDSAQAPAAAASAAAAAPAPEPEEHVHIVGPLAPAVPPMHVAVAVPALPALPAMKLEVPPLNIDTPALNMDGPGLHLSVPPMHLQIPQLHIQTPGVAPMPPQDIVVEPPMTFSMSGDWNFYRGGRGGYYVGRYGDWGPRFAIVTHDSDEVTMAGDWDDAEHARSLKNKISGDFIWLERDGKSYVITDSATVNRAKQLWQPAEDLSKQEKELGKQMQDLSKQAEDSRQKMEDMKIKLPDLSAEMQKLQESMKQLSASGGTFNEIGEFQRQIGELQREIGQAESAAGRDNGAWGREQGEWGRKMGEVGRKMGDIGRKQGEVSRDAARQMRDLLDEAVSKGLAKPE